MSETETGKNIPLYETNTFIDKISGETFIIIQYNGISIIQKENDKYVNASKIGNDNKKQTRKYISSKTFQQICDKFKSKYPQIEPYYILRKGYSDSYFGIYVHPKLIHFICYWADIDYAFTVAEIMDLINERNQLTIKISIIQ